LIFFLFQQYTQQRTIKKQIMVSNKQVIFSKYPTAGSLLPGVHIQVIESTIDLDASLAEGEFILKTLELAIDPYVETRLRDPAVENWSPPIPLNDVIADETLSVVVRSNSADYKVGDLVYSYILKGHFAEYVKVTAEYAAESYVVRNEARESKLPLSHYVSVLGMSGMTAYSGYG
jgi:NADPH-dependent curcumin reductase CurA